MELNFGTNPEKRNLWGYGWKKGYNDPWKDQATSRKWAARILGTLTGGNPVVMGGLLGAQKIESLLDPYGWNRPFHKSKETMEKEKAADIESRDDSPIIAQERRRLWKLYQRLKRPADLAAFKEHVRQHG